MKRPHAITLLFPPPRRPVRLRDVLSLVLFGLLFAGVCLGLAHTHRVMFALPRAFWLSILFVWLWWIGLCGRSGVVGLAAVVALWIRLTLAGVLIMALAEPRAVRTNEEMVVVYALDVSDSIGDDVLTRAMAFMSRTVQGKPERDKAGLVVFGRRAGVELPPRESFPFEAINVRVPRDGSNLERALALSSAMLPDSSAGRIVLLSDGAETEGDAAAILPELTSRGIRVDALPIAYTYEREVWLERLDLPRVVKSGETYEASVVLSSLAAGSGTLTLTENGKTVAEQRVTFKEGKNRLALPLYMRGPGFYEYAARIQVAADEDGWQENNLAVNHLYLKGEGRVLVVTGGSDGGEHTRWLCEAMRASGLLLEEKDAFELPLDALSYLPYDSIVFVNVAADELDAARMQAIHDAVVVQGSGFLMVGGQNSFGAGGYNRSLIEKILPVSMDIKKRKALPKGALAIILHTCEFAEGNTWGKRIAKEAMRVLGAQDEVGVLVYSYGTGSSGERWLFPLTPASEYEKLVPLINNATIGDMPSFATTMELGYKGLMASDAASRHMIIISDGDPSPPPPALLGKFAASQISVSTVAINPHGGQEQTIMGAIASATGGRYYFPQDPRELPSIFIKEAKTLRRNIVQNRTFTPSVGFPSSIMKGIDTVPPLHGLVLTMAKPRAETVLLAPDEDDSDPLLAVWRHGLGTTAAFTSDLSSNWGRDWVKWDRYRPFVRQLMTAIGRVEQKRNLFVNLTAEGSEARVLVEDHHASPGFLDLTAEVSLSGGASHPVDLRQVGPRLYEGSFPLAGSGRYQLLVAGSGDGRREHAAAGLMVPYSPEYLRFRSDPVLLAQIASSTGGRLLTGTETGETLFNADREVRRDTRPITDWFLWALAFLLPLDVAVRRVRIDWRELWRHLAGRQRGPASKTLGSLLARKQHVDRGLAAVRETHGGPAPTASPRRATRTAPRRQAKADCNDEEQAPPSDEPTSTTGQLLARKRQWHGDKEE
ncbi:MAG: VWA domain-containing protein [Lentisphaerae bacterium]|nr:VWA domain-containing protein [Lentisphaerota bacterium]